MKWDLKSDRPIYAQLVEQITFAIVSSQFPPGSKLPSVRDLAQEAAVNPNTMQKALSELERSGLVYAQRTAGRFVTEDTEMIQQVKKELAIEQIERFLEQMRGIGISREELIAIIREKHGEVN
jgi:GntR family transcriptional regulator